MKTIADKKKSVIERLSLIDLEILELSRREDLARQKAKTFLKELELELYYPPQDIVYQVDSSSIEKDSGNHTQQQD